ncbi:hypothetical protein O0L34_g17866 [Tuta absoluta]|nr:hypothetical protein O0L34_g17866 [Tuta absoluta]
MPKFPKARQKIIEGVREIGHNKKEKNKSCENPTYNSERLDDTVEKKQMGRSALLKISQNSEPQHLDQLQPRATSSCTSTSKITYEELKVRPNEIVINMVHMERPEAVNEIKGPESDNEHEVRTKDL